MRSGIVALLVLAATAHADEAVDAPAATDGAVSAPSPEAVTAARGHFEAGRVYFGRGEWRRALEEFRAAARDLDRPEFDYNIAKSYDRLGDAARAVDYYRRYLAKRPDAADRAEVEQNVAALRARVGELVLETHTAGAALSVDDDPVAPGVALALTEGKHRAGARKDGFLPRTADLTLRGGETRRLTLVPIAPPVVVLRRPSRWWIGVLVAGAAVLAAGAVLTGVLVARAEASDLYSGNVPPGVVSVR
jgi:tetratricopeptide (TPR) repeat protein